MRIVPQQVNLLRGEDNIPSNMEDIMKSKVTNFFTFHHVKYSPAPKGKAKDDGKEHTFDDKGDHDAVLRLGKAGNIELTKVKKK